MNLIGHGIDLVECRRIAALLDDHRERFLERLLTPAERAYVERYRDPIPQIAGRFAAKEAVLKVLGTGWRGKIAWRDIEILNDPAGRPEVCLTGECGVIARKTGVVNVLVSITHTAEYAAASAISFGETPAQTGDKEGT